ncbi:MAG: hypothetical protein WA890_18570 [Micromonospora sp.]
MSLLLRRLSGLIRVALHNFPNPQPDLDEHFRTATAALQPDAPLFTTREQVAFAASVYATIRALPDTHEGDPR